MNAKRNRYHDPRRDQSNLEAAKKTPLLQPANRIKSSLKIQSTGSRKHAVHQPTPDPILHVANRGQVSKVTSSIRFIEMHGWLHRFL
jgi:hypothetical protein